MNWFHRWLRQRRLIRLAYLKIKLDNPDSHRYGWSNKDARKILQEISKLKIQLSIQDSGGSKVVQFIREGKQ